MSSIYDWSTTPASNASSDGDMTWAESQAPSTVNNSARQLVARVAELLGDMGGALAAGGTANGITITANSAFTTYANGRVVAFKAAADSTGAVTLNVNGIGAKAIRKVTASGDEALASGDIQQDGIYVCRYNTSLNSGAGAWQIINAPSVPTGTSGHVVGFLDGNNTYSGTSTFSGAVNLGTVTGTGTATFDQVHASGAIYQGDGSAISLAPGSGSSISGSATVVVRPSGNGTTAVQTRWDSSGNMFVAGSIGVSGTNILLGTTDIRTGGRIGISGGGTFELRPNGTGSTVGEMTIDTSGNAQIAGSLGVSGTNILLGTTDIRTAGRIGISGGGTFEFRPNGAGSAVGEMTLNTSGDLAVSGSITGNGIFADNMSSGTIFLRPNGSGSSTGQTTIAAPSGDMVVSGDITANSDRRLKRAIKPIKGALDLVRSLRGVTFRRRRGNTKGIGFIAQEVETVLPELVHEGEDGIKSVAYGNFTAVLVEAVKELAARVEKLEARK